MKDSYEIIEVMLASYKSIIGKDYYRYKNHVCRIYSYCSLMDDSHYNDTKYAIAAVFHDIGIWTDATFDYIEPSIEQASSYLTTINRQEWIEEITLMISWHHKISSYKKDNYETIEIFRKADWIDVSLGILNFEVKPKEIKLIKQQLPNLGFHVFLLKNIFKNLFKHPLNPLPMFKI
jgi:hypothetical protein